jgi:putative membrane protein
MRRTTIAAVAAAAALASPAVAAAKSYSPLDKFLLQSSIQGDRFEIAGGKLAESRGSTPEVRALGARLVKDHKASLADASRLARRLDISVPKTPTPSQEWELGVVGGLSGAAFDSAYTALEIQDHKQDIDDMKTEVSEGTDASVRHMARTELPTLRKHLALSRAAHTG